MPRLQPRSSCAASLALLALSTGCLVESASPPEPELGVVEAELSRIRFATHNFPARILTYSNTHDQQFLTGDFDGDRRTDIVQTSTTFPGIFPVCTATSTGWSCADRQAAPIWLFDHPAPCPSDQSCVDPDPPFLTGDFDGDGKTDLLETVPVPWFGGYPIFRSTGSGFQYQSPSATIRLSGSLEQQTLIGDFNGDRRSDVLQTYRGWSTIPVCTSRGLDSSFSCVDWPATVYDSGSREQRFHTGDFNKDGMTDVFQTYRGWHSIPTCRSFYGIDWRCDNYAATIYDSGSDEQQFLTGDFDGDGRTDIFQTYRGWHSIPVCLATSTGWSCSNLPATIYDSGSREQRFLAADVNGDRRTDIIQTYRGWGSYPVCLSTGTGWDCSNVAATIFNSGSREQRFLTGDWNGDGAAEIFQTYRGWGSIPVSVGTVTACGTSGDYCCDGNVCEGGLTCQSGVCAAPPPPCGNAGQACCSGGGCITGLNCQGGTCQYPPPPPPPPPPPSCGGHNEIACAWGECDPGLQNVNGVCYACGLVGMACCGWACLESGAHCYPLENGNVCGY